MNATLEAQIVNGKPPTREEFVALAHASGFAHLLKQEPQLPVGTLREAIPYLRRPFAPNALKFKIQTQFGGEKVKDGNGWKYVKPPSGGVVIAYVDARLVVEHLNKVCPHLWSHRFEIASLPGSGDKGLKVKCWLTIDGNTREDVGQASGMEAFKGAHSDALKRASKMFGVGVSLNAVPRVSLFSGQGANKLAVRGGESRGFYLALTEDNVAKLREGYARWLDTDAGKTFGAPLDHGDAEDAAGDPEDPDAPQAEATEQLFEDDAPARSNGGRKISAARVERIAALAAGTPPDSLLALLREVTGKPGLEDWLEGLKGLKGEQADAVEARLAGDGVGA